MGGRKRDREALKWFIPVLWTRDTGFSFLTGSENCEVSRPKCSIIMEAHGVNMVIALAKASGHAMQSERSGHLLGTKPR